MNVLLLTADSLRADRTSLFGHSRDTTPFLADLAADGFEFTRAYSNGRNTAASFPAIHTSTYQRYFEGIGIPSTGSPTLAEQLGGCGYRNHGINTNELIAGDYNYDRGFDVYQDSRSPGGQQDTGWRTTARDVIGDGRLFEIIKRAHFLSTRFLGVKVFDTADSVSGFEETILDWIRGCDDDWFVWAHYMNPHHPYVPPADCQAALGLDDVSARQSTKLSRKMRLNPDAVTTAERETIKGLYDASVLSWDREIASTYRALERLGALEDTLVVVTADHGEQLGEGGVFGHPPVLHQALLRVPLVFSGPTGSGRTESQVSLIDLAPTILSLAGCDVPAAFLGRPLFDADGAVADRSDGPIIAETGGDKRDLVCAIDDDRKLVCDVEAPIWEAYRLDDRGMSERRTDEPFEDLREALRDHLENAELNRREGAEIDEAALHDDLAALGYLDE